MESATLRGASGAWPAQLEEQEQVIHNIPASSWHVTKLPDVVLYCAMLERIACVHCNTAHGLRKFDVWANRQCMGMLLVVRERCKVTFVTHCSLRQIDEDVLAEFWTLGGQLFATQRLCTVLQEAPLRVEHVQDVAKRLALEQGLLETRNQEVKMLLEGFPEPIPSQMILWHPGRTAAEMCRRLAFLRALPADALEAMVVTEIP